MGLLKGFVADPPQLVKARRRMVEESLVARGIVDPLVLHAMRKVPRHLFVDQALWSQAYGDHALPIGEKQTISQPYIVGLMTQTLALCGSERVLEVGTGSGYQTAILAEIVEHVYSIERIPRLARQARDLLDTLGYWNTAIKVGDGWHGWQDNSPFDAILVTAAATSIPHRLVAQLTEGGTLVIPVVTERSQHLYRIRRKAGDTVEKECIGPCRFVRMVSNKQGLEGS